MSLSSQSNTLSNSLRTFSATNSLLTNSIPSEKSLESAVAIAIKYANDIKPGGKIYFRKTISLSELKTMIGIVPNAKDSRTYIQPDGGFVFWEYMGKHVPILISEDKHQGTNDNRFNDGLGRQSTGNAIERAGKNINAVKPLFMDKYNIYPYALFCAGCDFHSSETISTRIEGINCFKGNHYLEVTSENDDEKNEQYIVDNILMNIDIKKWHGEFAASTFIKAHKWNELPNGASKWNVNERSMILKYIVKQAMVYYDKLFNN